MLGFPRWVFSLNGKICHGTLVGLTHVKHTSADAFLLVFNEKLKKLFLALVGLTRVKGTSVRTKVENKDRKGLDKCNIFSSNFDPNLARFRSKILTPKLYPKNIEFYLKGVPQLFHNRFPNSSKINAKTRNGQKS